MFVFFSKNSVHSVTFLTNIIFFILWCIFKGISYKITSILKFFRQGPEGVAGVQGNTGLPGEKGDKGTMGAPGLQGSPGSQGSPGPQGLRGLTGAPGAGVSFHKSKTTHCSIRLY